MPKATDEGIVHQGLREEVQMNKYHLILVLRRRQQQAQAGIEPRPDWWIATLAIFLTLFFVLTTASFKDALGTDKATLHAVAIILTWAALIATLGLLAWWIQYVRTRTPQPTPEEEVAAIIKEMDKDEERLETLVEKAKQGA
jgi:hypothetical protein